MSNDRAALLSLYHDPATTLLDTILAKAGIDTEERGEEFHEEHVALVEALADAHTDGRGPGVSTTVPDETIAAIEARLNAATPGDWRTLDAFGTLSIWADARKSATDDDDEGDVEIAFVEGRHAGNADLIAHAPEDLRALLAEVRRLTADRAITHEQAVQACANVGVDLTCGACAAVFYTGVGSPHDVHTCAGRDESDALRRSAEAAIRETGALRDGVTEAIGLAWRPIPQPFGATAYACPDDRDIIEAARTVVKERDEARAQVERLTDLVRHQRGALHTEGLITDAEYADLAGLTGSPARLEGYDALRGELERTKRALNVAIGERGAANRDADTYRQILAGKLRRTDLAAAQNGDLMPGPVALASLVLADMIEAKPEAKNRLSWSWTDERTGKGYRVMVEHENGESFAAALATARLDGARAMLDKVREVLGDVVPDGSAVAGSGS